MAAAAEPLQLVYCQKCRNPIGKVAPGSRVEIRCHRCGTKTYFENLEVKHKD